WFAHGPLSLIGCLVHMPVGFAGSGFANTNLFFAVLEDELGRTVAVDVLQQHEFTDHRVGHRVGLPAAGRTRGVHVQHRRPLEDRVQDVRPSVAGEIIRALQSVEMLRARIDGPMSGSSSLELILRARDVGSESCVAPHSGRHHRPAANGSPRTPSSIRRTSAEWPTYKTMTRSR